MKMKQDASAGAMRMRHVHLPFAGIVAMFLAGVAGCASVYRTTPGSLTGMGYKGADAIPLEQVYITTTGYYCLWSIPLASGDLRWNAEKQSINGGTCLFRDQVSATELQNALLKIAESRDCDVFDIVFDDSDTSYAGVSYEGIIGLFFGSSHIGVSGVLVPKKRQPEVKEEGVE